MIAVRASDGKQIAGLADRFRRAESASYRAEPAAVVPVLARMLDAYYDARQSPDGRAWEPRVSGGSWPLLEKTGRLRR